jgi:hypothetical protein
MQHHVRILPDRDTHRAHSSEESVGQHKVALRPIANIEIDHHPLGQGLQ